MRILITGVTGFVGSYLAEHLLERQTDAEVWGLVRWSSKRDQLGPLEDVVRLVDADLTDASSLVRAMQAARPDVVFHLAGASTVASSWTTPAEIFNVNTIGQIHLFEAMRTLNIEPITVIASSAEAYGRTGSTSSPLDEAAPFEPVSPYGVSKAAQDLLAQQYFAGYALPTVRLRLFNHTGPRRPDRFVASSFARQIAAIERGEQPPRLLVGDLNAVRDFTDVRDIARAYWLAAMHGKPGEAYNVCSGKPVSIRSLLDRLMVFTEEEVEIQVDPGRLRAAEITRLYGSATRFKEATGWEPVIPFDQTLLDMLNWWRQRV
ncbi:MAG: GDP-mannose 4,6-dehydratase [bacterium]|nr:GDP-mannose 4,6-dehydratase [bacterium]